MTAAAGQFLEEGGAIIGRHLVDDLDNLFLAHGLEQALLVFAPEVFKGAGGEAVREDAEDDDLVAGREVGHQFGEIRGRPFGEDFLEGDEVALLHQLLNFRA